MPNTVIVVIAVLTSFVAGFGTAMLVAHLNGLNARPWKHNA